MRLMRSPKPTVKDFEYGNDSQRQKLDFWQATSDTPTPLVLLIHGGGWKGGDKSDFLDADIKPYLEAGISVAAINYRFIAQAMEQNVEPPVKACLYDAARALQTIRSKAKQWNLDPSASALRVYLPAHVLLCGWRFTMIWRIRTAAILWPKNQLACSVLH